MGDHNEYRPPTQSQKPNIFSGSIPKASTAALLVLTATKCLAMCDVLPPFSKNHSLALCALVMVSWVVKVLDETINNVVCGSRFFTFSKRCAASILETK